jgi:hypothetical protein
MYDGDGDAFRADASKFDRVYRRILGKAHLSQLIAMEHAWLGAFTLMLDSEKQALETLEPGAAVPPMKFVTRFIFFMATAGQSRLGIPGVTGWSATTTRNAISRMWTMVSWSFCSLQPR